MLDERLLHALADGRFHSGQALGARLGISRSAVWKQIAALEQLGLEIYRLRGRGYRLPQGLDLLDEQQIRQACQSGVLARLDKIELKRVSDSTNLMAMRDLPQISQPGARLYLSEYQSHGRGRRGRSWVSPFTGNLCFSLSWHFSQGVAALEGLSLVVGVALVQALASLEIRGVGLKWPNDLLVDGRKLAGILLEVQGDAAGDCQVIIGVGINVALPEEAFSAIDQPCTDLQRLTGHKVSRNQLMAAILNQLIPKLEDFQQQGFAPYRQDWQALHVHQLQPVRLTTGTRQVVGQCLGVDERGALLLQGEAGIQAYYAGEVSVRAEDAS